LREVKNIEQFAALHRPSFPDSKVILKITRRPLADSWKWIDGQANYGHNKKDNMGQPTGITLSSPIKSKGVAMNRIKLVLAGGLACVLLSCAPTSDNSGSAASGDPAVVSKVRDEFIAAFNSADAAKVASLYAPDAVVMPSHQHAITGRDGIENYNKMFFEMFTATINISPVETKVFGDRGLDRGTYTIQMTPKAGGSPIMDEGKYLVLLQRQADGSWKLTHDIDNTSIPVPSETTK